MGQSNRFISHTFSKSYQKGLKRKVQVLRSLSLLWVYPVLALSLFLHLFPLPGCFLSHLKPVPEQNKNNQPRKQQWASWPEELNSILGRVFCNHCLFLNTVSLTYLNEVIFVSFLKQKLLRDKKWQTFKSKHQWLSPNLLIFRETPMFRRLWAAGLSLGHHTVLRSLWTRNVTWPPHQSWENPRLTHRISLPGKIQNGKEQPSRAI